MMKYALVMDAPVAVRYPRGEAYSGLKEFRAPVELGKAELLYAEGEVCLLAVGSMVVTALAVRELLKEYGSDCSSVNARFVQPLDEKAVEWAARNHRMVVTMEENVASGGFGEKVREYFDTLETESMLMNVALPDDYVEHGNVDLLKHETGIDAESITSIIRKELVDL